MPIFNFFLCLIFLIPFLLGSVLLSTINHHFSFSRPVKFSFAYGLGLGLLAQIMLLMGVLNIPYHTTTICLLSASLSVILFGISLKNKKRYSPADPFPWKNGSYLLSEKILFTLTILYLGYHLFFISVRTFFYPMVDWDSMATAAFNGKVIFYNKSLLMLKDIPHPSFPLGISFLFTWVSLFLGFWDDQLVQVFFTFFLVSFTILQFTFLKRLTNVKWALLGCVMLFSSPLVITHACTTYRDIPMMFYNCSCLICLILWSRKREVGLLCLAGFLSGFATFTKLEGYAYILIHFLVLCLLLYSQKIPFKEKSKKFLEFAVPSLGILFFFILVKISRGIPVNEKAVLDLGLDSFTRIPFIIRRFSQELFVTANWNIIWFLFMTLCILNFRKIFTSLLVRVTTLSLFGFLGIHIGVAMLTKAHKDLLNPMTLSRLLLHFFPVVIWAIIFLMRGNEEKRG